MSGTNGNSEPPVKEGEAFGARTGDGTPRTPREVAHRVFAAEYNQATVAIKGQDERAPSYVLTPLGAKVNRLFIVGVLTDVEKVNEQGEFYRARVSDPTGVFTVYSGQYQAEATATLSQLQPPCYVAIVGKCRTYEPEAGQVYVSVRPESVTVVDEATRDLWVLETARATTRRISAASEASEMDAPTVEKLSKLGFPRGFAEGAILAKERYGEPDLSRYASVVAESLGYLKPGVEVPVHRIEAKTMVAATAGGGATTLVTAPGVSEELEQWVLAEVQRLLPRDATGAPWDEIVATGAGKGHTDEIVEEALNSLMDKGLIYEPVLGRLKPT